MKKICNCCGLEKDISKFEWQPNRPNPRKTCKLCRSRNRIITEDRKLKIKAYKKAYRESGRAKDVWEKHKYGVSKSEIAYTHCVICGSTHRLHIDHCHTTGNFRALLCSNCNTGIGMFKENIEIMNKAINYLKYFESGDKEGLVDLPHFQLD